MTSLSDMARIRTVKPEFWDDEKMSKHSLCANLLFIGLWNFADDAGIVRKSPVWIKSKVFPHREEIRINDVKSWIHELENARMLIPFEYKEEGYYWIRTFHKHQRIDKPQPSKVPDSLIVSLFEEYSENAPRRFLAGREGKGEEGNGAVRTMESFKIEDCKLIGPERIVYETAKVLYDRFKEKFPNNKDLPLIPILNWIAPVRSLVKKEYTREQIFAVAKWAVNDKFWKKTILTAEALEKHFERLKLEYQDAGKTTD